MSGLPEPPAGFVVRAGDGCALYVAESEETELRERGLHTWEAWNRALAAGSRSGGRGATAVVGADAGPRWRLKTMRRGGILGRLWRDRYPTAARLVATLAASEQARIRGIPTARPIALIVDVGSGGLARGAMAFEEIERSEDLAHRALRKAVTLADLAAAVSSVRAMHDRGVHHVDLNLGNILLRAGSRELPEAFLIDFDRAVVGPAARPFADRQSALRRLERSCAKLTGAPGLIGPGSEDLWYSLYAGDDVALAGRLARGRPAGRLALAVSSHGMEEERIVTQAPKLEKMKEMAARFPDDPRARYFLAHELFRVEDWAGAAEQYDAYVQLKPGDEGAALKSLGLCYERLGRHAEAGDAYRRGIERALACGHEGLASEIRFLLGEFET